MRAQGLLFFQKKNTFLDFWDLYYMAFHGELGSRFIRSVLTKLGYLCPTLVIIVTWYLVPGTWYLAPGTWYLVAGSWYLLLLLFATSVLA